MARRGPWASSGKSMSTRTVTDDTLFDSQNAAYAQAMFEEYARNPDSLPAEWRRLFENGASLALAEGLLMPDQLAARRTITAPPPTAEPQASAPPSTPTADPPVSIATPIDTDQSAADAGRARAPGCPGSGASRVFAAGLGSSRHRSARTNEPCSSVAPRADRPIGGGRKPPKGPAGRLSSDGARASVP